MAFLVLQDCEHTPRKYGDEGKWWLHGRTYLGVDCVRDQVSDYHQHFLVDLSNGVGNLQTAAWRQDSWSNGVHDQGAVRCAAYAVRLWRCRRAGTRTNSRSSSRAFDSRT